MPKKKKADEKPEEQFERFVEAARTLGVEESGKNLEEVFDRLKPVRKPAVRKN